MKKFKILKNEKIVLDDTNIFEINFLNTNAIAILKVVDYLCSDNILLFNPIDLIMEEFTLKFNDKSDEFIYNAVISCLITACKYKDNELKFYNTNLLKY